MSCTLPSRSPGYPFAVYLTGAWQDLPVRYPHQHPQDAATDHALDVAREVTAARQLSEAPAAEAGINARLGRPIDLPHAPIRLLWARISLTADPQQAAHADHLLRERHQAEAHAHNDQLRLQRAKDLREALLNDPALALSYWFLDHPETIGTASVERVEQLMAAAAKYAPHTTWVQVAQLLQEFVRDLPHDAHLHLIDRLAHIFDRHGQHDRAQQLRSVAEKCQVPAPPQEPDHG